MIQDDRSLFEKEYDSFCLKQKRLKKVFIFSCFFVLLVFFLGFKVFAEDVNTDATTSVSDTDFVDSGDFDSSGSDYGASDGGNDTSSDGSGDTGGSYDYSPEPTETPVVDVSRDSIDAIADAVNSSSTEPTGPLKVDLTDDSISAISDAVTDSTNMTLTTKSGVCYTVPSCVADVWADYNYIVVILNGSVPSYFLTDVQPSYTTLFKPGVGYFPSITISSSGVYCSNNKDLRLHTNTSSDYVSSIIWSNFTLRDGSGQVVYLSDVAEPVYYNVSFVSGFDDLILSDVTTKDFVAPVLSYDGFKFDGWYLDPEFTKPYTDSFVFSSDCTLFANWIPYRSIKFVTNISGFELSSVSVLSGVSYFVPTFSYASYEFLGAYTDDKFVNLFVDGTVIDEDITLYLKFSEIQYDIGGLVTQLLDVAKGLDVIESQLWIILVVGLMYFVYKFFRIFF